MSFEWKNQWEMNKWAISNFRLQKKFLFQIFSPLLKNLHVPLAKQLIFKMQNVCHLSLFWHFSCSFSLSSFIHMSLFNHSTTLLSLLANVKQY
mmetsp:Transcript_18927/g.23838  ORF Transcript_18927/g.23838 Transcript_18927/m.23838 type:complete len:93 (+) Transcript_18927:1656-1934(+)